MYFLNIGINTICDRYSPRVDIGTFVWNAFKKCLRGPGRFGVVVVKRIPDDDLNVTEPRRASLEDGFGGDDDDDAFWW